jgi:hypothetical protein
MSRFDSLLKDMKNLVPKHYGSEKQFRHIYKGYVVTGISLYPSNPTLIQASRVSGDIEETVILPLSELEHLDLVQED